MKPDEIEFQAEKKLPLAADEINRNWDEFIL